MAPHSPTLVILPKGSHSATLSFCHSAVLMYIFHKLFGPLSSLEFTEIRTTEVPSLSSTWTHCLTADLSSPSYANLQLLARDHERQY